MCEPVSASMLFMVASVASSCLDADVSVDLAIAGFLLFMKDKHALVKTILRETVYSHMQASSTNMLPTLVAIDAHDSVTICALSSNTFARSWQRDNFIVHAATDSNMLPASVAIDMPNAVAHNVSQSCTSVAVRQVHMQR